MSKQHTINKQAARTGRNQLMELLSLSIDKKHDKKHATRLIARLIDAREKEHSTGNPIQWIRSWLRHLKRTGIPESLRDEDYTKWDFNIPLWHNKSTSNTRDGNRCASHPHDLLRAQCHGMPTDNEHLS
jgi:hypothetical protein